jgi:hypothetical protein
MIGGLTTASRHATSAALERRRRAARTTIG